jgi:hypothetical protein
VNRFGKSKPVERPVYVVRINGQRVATFRNLCNVRAFIRECPEPANVRVLFPDLHAKTLVSDR